MSMTEEGRRGDPVIRRLEPFADFYRREFPRMVTIACAVSGSRLAAEDIAQEALIEAERRWDVVGRYDKPGAWVRRVTIQRASKRLRRLRVEAAAMLKLGPVDAIPEGPPEVDEVLDAVARLPMRQRAAVVLHYFDGYSVAEVAEILECAEGTAKAHLHKARTSLARMLGEEVEA
jgi:RNA polymerase sigma-70 factor (ECF subfamily)